MHNTAINEPDEFAITSTISPSLVVVNKLWATSIKTPNISDAEKTIRSGHLYCG